MKEKAVMVFIGLLTALLITITMVDVLDDAGRGTAGTNEQNSSNIADNGGTGNVNGDGSGDNGSENNNRENGQNGDNSSSGDNGNEGNGGSGDTPVVDMIVDSTGTTLATRVNAPTGYTRSVVEAGSLGEFLRNYTMKEAGGKVLLYDGTEKDNQTAHAAVFTLPIEAKNLQQSADTIMRVYAEYYLITNQLEKIVFCYSDGFKAEYAKWIEGNGISVVDGKAKWIKKEGNDASYDSFKEYMRLVFAYAGIWTMKNESSPIELKDATIGDIFFDTSDSGRVVMIVDVCENADGKKAYLLASGGKPAQEFVLLNNPLHTDDPWYYEDEMMYPLDTPEFDFKEGSLRRLVY